MKSNRNVTCPLCGCAQSKIFLENRPDHEYGIARKLDYYPCCNKSCFHVFVFPLPSIEEIKTFYAQYSTHDSTPLRGRSSIVKLISSWYSRKNLRDVFGCGELGQISVLDFGCGNGNFMRLLQSIGIESVVGYDFDPAACSFGISQGLKCLSTFDEVAANGPYDFIFLNHVIEHFSDPTSELNQIAPLMKNGGAVFVRTPNSQSLLARIFGNHWRGWETPRHLNVFNSKNIWGVVKSDSAFFVSRVYSSNAMFLGIFNESLRSNFWRTNVGRVVRWVLCILAFLVAVLFNKICRNSGEEVCAVLKIRNKADDFCETNACPR